VRVCAIMRVSRFPGAVGTHQLSGESVRHYARARFPGAVGTHQLSGESVRVFIYSDIYKLSRNFDLC
jgi:hypothetical protein